MLDYCSVLGAELLAIKQALHQSNWFHWLGMASKLHLPGLAGQAFEDFKSCPEMIRINEILKSLSNI